MCACIHKVGTGEADWERQLCTANKKVLSSIPARDGGAPFGSTLWAQLLSQVALQDREESALSVCNNATASIPLNVGCSTFFKT